MGAMALMAMLGGAAYMMMDKQKKANVEKILNNAADEASKMMKKTVK